ncbi:MAG: dihydropteroate synthase, partial [Actinomycetota bacterium]|nr:dihydropteroate synthase [Actinomycetota bacterium]
MRAEERFPRPSVMGVVNVTPDSFSDGGVNFEPAAAVATARRLYAEGAAIVDIGGVKAAPGVPVDAAEELDRVLDLVEQARERHPQIVISVDTFRASVGDAVCRAGADLINDAWGGWEPELAEV